VQSPKNVKVLSRQRVICLASVAKRRLNERERNALNKEQTMATDRTNQTTKTARERYEERRRDIDRILHWLTMELDAHRAKFEDEPTAYAYAGDLGHVREKLIEMLAFLSNSDIEEIESVLSECR
jgi:hypothetical protein